LVEQLFGRAVWTQKALFQEAIFISLFGGAFCENNITIQEFEQIASYVISLL